MVIVSNEEEPAGAGFGEKNLLTLAPGKFVNDAAAGSTLVIVPLAVITAPAGIVFVRLPLTFMVALRVSVQSPRGGRLPRLNEKDPSPAAPVRVPPHVPTSKFTGLARTMPVGITSEKPMPVSGTDPGLFNWMLILEADPPKTVNGSNPFTSAMEKLPPLVTVKVEDTFPTGERPSVLVKFVGGIVFV